MQYKRCGDSGAIAIEALASIPEVAEGNQSRGVGLHGPSMMLGQAHVLGLNK